MISCDVREWHEVIVDEIESVIKNDTLVLVDRLENLEDHRIVLQNKFDLDEKIEKRKT